MKKFAGADEEGEGEEGGDEEEEEDESWKNPTAK